MLILCPAGSLVVDRRHFGFPHLYHFHHADLLPGKYGPDRDTTHSAHAIHSKPHQRDAYALLTRRDALQ